MAEEQETVEEKNDIEDLAEELGWNPNWEGPDEEKVSAAEYIRRSQKILRRSSEDISSLKNELGSVKSTMKEMAINHTKQTRQALDAQKQRLEEERAKAVEEGDTAAFNKADKQLNNLRESDVTEPENDKQKAFQDGFEQFRKDNDWFDKDPLLRAQAIQAGQAIGDMNPNIEPEEFYKKVLDTVKEWSPDKFASPSNKPTAVSGDRPEKPKGKTKWDELVSQNPEIKDIFADEVSRGVFKDTKEEREEYAKAILEEQ